MKTLADLRRGESATITRLVLGADVAARLMAAGFVPEACVTLIHCGPVGGPRVYLLDGAEVAIRRELAAGIQVKQHP